jgi:hypothetical protein|tara:strand:+ start:93486 stop:93971 length:486 start_codon:yes stop_codon:yes gene_type:complete
MLFSFLKNSFRVLFYWHYFFSRHHKQINSKKEKIMKKLMLTAIFALGTLTAMQAQEKEVEVETNVEVQDPTQQEDTKLMAKMEANTQAFKEIQVADLPAAVAKAVATDFKGATVTKAYVNKSQEFKLVLETATDEKKVATKTVFATKEGAWIKKPKAELKQ